MTIGLKGHVLGPAFPEGYSNWQKTDLHDLIDAELIKEPTDKNVVKAIKKVAKEADELVIATDFDREGELIGLEALEEMLDVNPELGSARAPPTALTIKRARYSALTKEEIERAFANLDTLSYPLANAGAARQDIDLLWGATPDPRRLAREPPLRLQLPLGRPRAEPDPGPDRRARDGAPRPRRQTVLGAVRQVRASRRQLRDPPHASTNSGTRPRPTPRSPAPPRPGVVKSVTARKNTRKPPTPYNTTAFSTDASSRLGITPAQRDADRRGPLHGRLHLLPAYRQHGLPGLAAAARAGHARWSRSRSSPPPPACSTATLKPTRGKKETTDHPPIYPTQAIHPGALDGPKKRVYELVVRRFLATFSPPMITESTRADIEAGSETYFVRGSVVVDPGYAGIYTYARSADEEIPALEEGQELALDGEPWIVDKETQPPVADLAGETDRDDGGARPRHQGDPRRHHPEALRPRLRLRQPAGSRPRPGSRCTRRSRTTCRRWRRRR